MIINGHKISLIDISLVIWKDDLFRASLTCIDPYSNMWSLEGQGETPVVAMEKLWCGFQAYEPTGEVWSKIGHIMISSFDQSMN